MKVGIIDYGMGNLGSVRRALSLLGAEAIVASHPSQVVDVDRLVLPGVGSFSDGMASLQAGSWIAEIQRQVVEGAIPLLGICLGMQLLATSGDEGGGHAGLDLIPGRVRYLADVGCGLRIPHVGWNEIRPSGESALLRGIPEGTDFYFVHSFVFCPEDSDDVLATATYDVSMAAVVRNGNVYGTQFHPEKSSKAGFRILKNFLESA